MDRSTHVILIEFAESAEMRELAVGLAARGDSIGLACQTGETSSDALDRLQLLLEQTGGISCAISLEQDEAEAIGRAIQKTIDLFGRVDEVVYFSQSLADDARQAIAKMPSRTRPKLHSSNDWNCLELL